MSLAAAKSEPIPIVADADGVLRVEGTRVPLATIVEAFREGATPEEIVLRYPSPDLADVYSVINYVLHHRPEVEAYLAEQRRQSSHYPQMPVSLPSYSPSAQRRNVI